MTKIINIHEDSFMFMTGVMSCLWHTLMHTPSNKVLPIFSCSLQLGPKICLLELTEELPHGFKGGHLLQILLHCACKSILLLWITDITPSVALWVTVIRALFLMKPFLQH